MIREPGATPQASVLPPPDARLAMRLGLVAAAMAAAIAAAVPAIATANAGADLSLAPLAQTGEVTVVAPTSDELPRLAVFLGHDPFTPIRSELGEDLGAVDDLDGIDDIADIPDGQADPDGACSRGATVVCDGVSVLLVDVFSEDGVEQVIVNVDGVLHTAVEGQTFATSFQVLSISEPCVTLLYGDDAFTLCEGEQILK